MLSLVPRCLCLMLVLVVAGLRDSHDGSRLGRRANTQCPWISGRWHLGRDVGGAQKSP